MTAGSTYTLWAVNGLSCGPEAAWSQGLLINDARPMWVSPGPRTHQATDTSPHGGPYDPWEYPEVSWAYQNAGRPGLEATGSGMNTGRTLKVVGETYSPPPVRRPPCSSSARGRRRRHGRVACPRR
jgi:hypothetical protein